MHQPILRVGFLRDKIRMAEFDNEFLKYIRLRALAQTWFNIKLSLKSAILKGSKIKGR